jgi:hypothetical protein
MAARPGIGRSDQQKPKIEGRRPRRPSRNVGPTKKEFVSTVVGLESHTFEVGKAKYTAKFQKSCDVIAIHIQRDCKGGANIAKAIRYLVLPTFPLPTYPVPEGNPAVIDPEKQYMCQQKAQATEKHENLLEDNKKQAYALLTGQCSPEVVSKIKGSDLFKSAD